MHADFWLDKWNAGQIGFHADAPNAYLQKWWDTLDLPDGAHVLVPLAGKSLDLEWLAAKRLRVTAVELSPLAVAEVVERTGAKPLKSIANTWRDHDLTIIQGDFFEVSGIGVVDAVWDRAARIALPPALRERYDAALRRLAPTAKRLMVTLDYAPGGVDRPPFSMSADTIRKELSDYRLELLESVDHVLLNTPFARNFGADRMIEDVWRVEPK